ncbi:MAG: LytTR family DNA-binding domain-containing protein [Firmicutes bacterium]|nr:LytTR family DNA-binding domain-containing protein [Bacillota bacterium]
MCDDETAVLDKIYNSVLTEFQRRSINAECIKISESTMIADILRSTKTDAVFLDIDMPHISGMEIARMIKNEKLNTTIIFVTCHDMLVYDTFQYSPFAFIRKSHFDIEISGVIDRIIENWESEKSYLIIKKGQQVVRIKTSEVIYIESEGNYVNICLPDGCEKYRDTLSSIENQDGGISLIRVHKGFIVNINQIERTAGDCLIMSNGHTVPVGRNYEKAVRAKILEMFRKQV